MSDPKRPVLIEIDEGPAASPAEEPTSKCVSVFLGLLALMFLCAAETRTERLFPRGLAVHQPRLNSLVRARASYLSISSSSPRGSRTTPFSSAIVRLNSSLTILGTMPSSCWSHRL